MRLNLRSRLKQGYWSNEQFGDRGLSSRFRARNSVIGSGVRAVEPRLNDEHGGWPTIPHDFN